VLSVEDLTIKFAERPLLGGVSFRVQEGDRVALAGRNGQGKSTLFRAIAGQITPDGGRVNIAKGRRIGYLPQDIQPPEGDGSALEEVLQARPELETLEAQVARLTEELTARPQDDALLAAYGKAQAEFEALDGYAFASKARTVLDGLGFSQERMDGPLRQLSGGWLMRVQLARLLLMAPDLLLLDEPTNHLDIEAREWLLDFLGGYPGAVILTSHDRYFLDAMVRRVLELEGGRLEVYSGDYTAYESEKGARLERLKAAHARQQRELKAQWEFIERNRANAATASNVQSRIKQVEKVEVIELPPEPPKIKLRFPEPPRSGQVAFRCRGLGKAYGETRVFSDLDLEVERGEKLVVTGVNGAGKTTLLKLIAGRIEPTEGDVQLGHNVTLQFFSQYEDDVLDTSRTLLQVMEATAPKECPVPPRTILGCFLFSGDEVDKRVSVLSGGERARLKIARMLLRPSNLLVLDEPTNHLDLHSQDILRAAVRAFEGTVVFVSHDREFSRELATQVLHIEGGRAVSYPCDYEQYRWRLAQEIRRAAEQPDAAAQRRAKDKAAAREAAIDARERRRDLRRAQKAVDALQERLEAQEARLGELEELMSDPSFFDSAAQSDPAIAEHEELKRAIDAAYGELEGALARLEALEE